ncbi:hypothetical protein RV11_GL002839 [Enterococcus phoeniculicola]|jgi:aminoglycoside phosphotransferase (APT) family kinase protein|uniref:Aminoglycoside phosphotransferase domain-containing protein n=1 Tax=Enterococcus phoeniculicola ATCC BAA-412 TaxID=1158610 RepID=R3TJP3_9ENTE|nr:phosphotransferase [Enterococcus phoeniculicola]EOL41639.1 hypothetical protein UC3_03204 [Enterococcus phoeniculicola ATCC BAA-412]EOT78867.1 hypothetical protein I589_00372 [Enterococcus phoeniculicola ATCC BAA-412]OJG72700.1 hypothetical protein RV11_GL002839 [Enterococcus phoeniculicola]
MDELKHIPEYASWREVRLIDKGWSSDKKYKVVTNTGEEQLLRVFSKQAISAKQQEFLFIKKVASVIKDSSQPIICGEIPNTPFGYMLLSYVQGRDLNSQLPELSNEQQFFLGKSAGLLLKTIHELPVPESVSQQGIQQRIYDKKCNQLQRYLDSEYYLEGQEAVLSYIEEQLKNIRTRPVCYQHGDFHVGNLIYLPSREIGVIDFNRWDFGDPYEEFYKLQSFSRETSPLFSYGQILGYFDGEVPESFWTFQKLYVAHISLFSVIWAIPYGNKQVEEMIARYYQFKRDYPTPKTLVPEWYNKAEGAAISINMDL